MDMKNTLRALCEAFGPTGRETRVAGIIEDMVKDYADEIRHDALGNLIAIRHGKGKRIMLAAHMDQIGFIVTGVDENGFLRIHPLGGIARNVTLGRKVVFENGVEGVIYFEQMSEGGSFDVDMKRMFIDIGAATRAEALSKVQIGDAATYAPGVIDMGARMSSPAMDNRAGCAVLVELLRDMQTDNEVACVFSTQEEVGLRGAKAAAFALDPDMGIALDVTPTRDTPKGFPHSVVLGEGPTIKIMDTSLICNPQVVADMRAAADRAGVKYQDEVLTGGGTDGAAMQLTRGGVPSGVISIPCRYVHTPVEMVEISDVEGAVKILKELVK
ncbi:MAG: M20/M25/M40 family metallo-hydrolase [Clostridiales bacterium]|nr:M20/M25/M40 family metallo-hydrolase [Clostridiales bacterium]